jgi:hypothetical protein
MKKTKFVLLISLLTMIMLVSIVNAEILKGPLTEFRLTSDDAVKNAEYGRSVAIDGNLVAVGMGGDNADGAVYLYTRQGRAYLLEEKLVNPDATPKAEFGRTVAIQGTTVFVGARFAQAGTTPNAGAVYVFRKIGDSWSYEDKIISPEPQEGDNFGRALAIQGNLLVVTARKNTAERGAAYIYEYTADGWICTATLVASDTTDGDYFGQSVALKGNIMVIGARNTANQNGKFSGGFYLFQQSGNTWTEVAKMTALDGNDEDQCGFAIAIKGNTVVVTARRADPRGLENAGAAYVYSLKGNSVEFVTMLTASDASKKDEFGQSVAFAGDVLAIGSWKDNDGKGSIYLFRQKGGQWSETGSITASDGVKGDEFGYSLAAIGNRMVTGAHKADFISENGGAAYVLQLLS